jgi:hypothetical protein
MCVYVCVYVCDCMCVTVCVCVCVCLCMFVYVRLFKCSFVSCISLCECVHSELEHWDHEIGLNELNPTTAATTESRVAFGAKKDLCRVNFRSHRADGLCQIAYVRISGITKLGYIH